MTDPTPTPGPWRACHDGECICGLIWADDGITNIAKAYGPPDQGDGCSGPASVPSREQQIANAKLLASAWTMQARIAELERMQLMAGPVRECPWCGLVPDVDNPATFRHETGDRWAAVVCCIRGPEIRAGFYTPLEEWKDEAIAAWNARAQWAPANVEVATLQQRIVELEAQIAAMQKGATE